jgi:hypothetical protein
MIGYESAVVNSQLVNVAPQQAFNPLVFGRSYVPVGAWPRQGVYNVPPVLPAGQLGMSMAPASYGGSGGPPGSYGVTPSAVGKTGSPWSLKSSPLWWALGFLTVGLLMLHFVHYKG